MLAKYAGAVRVAALALLWGSSFLWIKLGLDAFTPMQITVVRMVLGALTLMLVLRVKRLSLPSGVRLWGHLIVAALFGNAVPYTLFSIGEQAVSSSVAGVISASTPIWTTLLTVAAYRRVEAAKRNGICIAIGFAGVLLIFSPWRHETELMSWGAAAFLGAAISYGVSYVYIGRYLSSRELGPLPMAAGQLICASGIVLLAAPFFDWTMPQWQPHAIVALLILGALGTGIAYILNYAIIHSDGGVAASVVQYLLPVVAVVLGVLVLREPIHLQVVIGMVLVLVAARLRRPITISTSAR